MLRIILFMVLVTAASPTGLRADDRSLILTAPAEFAESGLAQFLLPRFALKTGTRVTLGPDGDLHIAADAPGTPVFQRGGTVYTMDAPATPAAERFADWLTSEIGRATIESFAPADGAPAFLRPQPKRVVATAVAYEGDAALGERIALRQCGRCHVVSERNRQNGIGSTPSFGVLRAQRDWGSRFEAFFASAPHPAFTQIEGLTEPFDISRPPPIVPLEMTLDDLDAILAFVSDLPPAELGAPIQHQ